MRFKIPYAIFNTCEQYDISDGIHVYYTAIQTTQVSYYALRGDVCGSGSGMVHFLFSTAMGRVYRLDVRFV